VSYALATVGATGPRYRPSMILHSLALSAGGFLGLDPSRPGVTYRWRLPRNLDHFWIIQNARAFFDRFAPEDGLCYSGQEGEGPNLEGLPACPPPDRGCEAYPNKDNDCFGMCGPGCGECWTLICGDCCYHEFCAVHDSLLRACLEAPSPAACVASIMVIPNYLLLGCDYDVDFWPF
jgi:hypothetical protein